MAITRKNIIEMICYNLGTQNYVMLDEFETAKARHICQQNNKIYLLDREQMNLVFPDGSGSILVEYYLCRQCGKLMLNKDNLTQVQPMMNNQGNVYGNNMYGNNGYGGNGYGNGVLSGIVDGMGNIW